MTNPLGQLANTLSSQYNLGSTAPTSLSAIVDGQNQQYGSLGSFQFDQSALRDYVESGFIRRDPYETDPEQLEILWQQPSATVLLKKRMFSSIAENFRPDFMDADEKTYYQALKVLFKNKCSQIAALEQLGKIQAVTAAVGNVSSQLVPIIITLADQANNGYASGANSFGLFPGGTNPFTTQDATSFFSVVDRLRTLYAYNQTAPYTTWLTDPTALFQSTLGVGDGVIEITNFTNITTNVGVDLSGPGTFSLSISDPYEAMLITDFDIEVALSDATNALYNNNTFQQGIISANQVITDQQNQLNQARASRNASPISINVNQQAIFGQPVTAVIDRLGLEIPFTYDSTGGTGIPGLGGFGNSVSVPKDYLQGGNLAGYDGLSTSASPIGPDSNIVSLSGNSELATFQALIAAIFNQIQLLSNSASGFTGNNQLLNYARRKLKFNFSGKLIIQPMDVVHIYMASKSQFDNKILAGLQQMFSGMGILQNFTNTLTSLTNATDTLFNPSANIAVQAEKSMYVGPNFPNYLWALIRTQFVTDIEGTHVFAGVVDSAVDEWQNGKFTINVSGKDNTAYFDQGKINFFPGMDNFTGLVFDPLTPFVSNFDSVVLNGSPANLTLLDENKYLLSETGSDSLLKYKQGALAGEKATSGNYIQDHTIDPVTGRVTRVFYAPDGLAYKWKQGIGIFTQSGSTTQINNPNLVGTPNIYKEPFAGLDVMNVISLLITGVPYNYATYFQATSNLNGFANDPQSGQNSVHTYLDSLRSDLSKSNALWGNFIPFKGLTMNEAAIAQFMQAQASINVINNDLNSKLQQFQDLQNTLVAAGAVNVIASLQAQTGNTPASSQITQLQAQALQLKQSTTAAISAIQQQTQQLFAQLNTTASQNSNMLADGQQNPTNSQAKKTIRRMVNYLTRRMSYDVRANQDKNLFIVDDYYDTDYDVPAFNQVLTAGLQQYNNTFTSIRENINNVKQLLNLEIYADTQGHIRARPPGYNKMPSSTFYRMLYLQQTVGVQVFPQFLNNLLTDQLGSLRQQIEVIEDLIRLDCAILGHYPSMDVNGDEAATDFIIDANITGTQGGTFSFLSDSTDTITDIDNLIQQANQEVANGTIDQSLSGSNFDQIAQAGTTTKQLFGNSERYTVLFTALQNQYLASTPGANINNAPTTNIFQSSIVQQLITRINTKSGQTITSADYLSSPGPNQPIQVGTGQTIDLFKVTGDLSTYIGQWQLAVKSFYHTIKNAAEYRSLANDTSTSNNLITPGIFNNSNIPEVYENMIEDETYDDYGPGSGQRYVIKNSQIRSLTISENAPDYTSVEVQGTLSPFFDEKSGGVGASNSGLDDFFPGGGNALTSAIAMDYDMWRNYGFKQAAVIKVPFLTDPNSQLGPYAAMVLTRNRSNILRGSCTISGNEYMQPGEVIYLETRNLLFYISSVRHNYTEGSSFTTTLELIYGHSIGDYIPTFMDTIGKVFYKNQETSNTVIQRQDSSGSDQSLGVIQLNGQNQTSSQLNLQGNTDASTANDPYATTNQTVLNNILYNTQYILNLNNTAGNNINASVELRIYYDNNNPINSSLQSAASQVMQNLLGSTQSVQSVSTANQPVQNASLPPGSVSVVTISMDDEADRRSPSQKAIDAARNQMDNTSINTGVGTAPATSPSNQALRTALFSYVIDCWITFTQVPPAQVPGATPTVPPQ
jgi:hypothetical protein